MVNIPKSDEWIISFHMRVPRLGYHWIEDDSGEWHLVQNWTDRRLDVVHLEGRRAGRNVVIAFRALGRQLRENRDLRYDDDQTKAWVLEFANRFGRLHAQAEGEETVRAWVDAATDFADICDVRDALNSGVFDSFKKRIRVKSDGIHYRRTIGKTWPFAPRGIDWQGAPGELRVNLFEHSAGKGAHAQAWALIAYVVNRHTDNGLSLRINPIRIDKPTLEASGVLANAYVRVWLDIVHRADTNIGIPQTCKYCGEQFKGNPTKRKEFCDSTCRKAYHRLKAA